MRFCAWPFSFVAVVAGIMLLAAQRNALGESPTATLHNLQTAEAKQVTINTVDHVELKGKYYPGTAASPCALMLHALGDSSSNKEWTNFAKKLQDTGYAVLMFDFRGHGDSTAVQPGTPNPRSPMLSVRGFWDEPLNYKQIKGFAPNKPRPTEIKYEQFSPGYLTVLANDIAAAKTWLDAQPDCNSSNLILIGANDGATLGALWLNAEFHRYRLIPGGPGQPAGRLDRQNPEGLAVRAAIWLSISPSFGNAKTPFNIAPMMQRAVKSFKTPMLFVYGEGDTKGGDIAKKTLQQLGLAKNKKDSAASTEELKIAGAEQMTGKNLLLDSLPTTGKIMKYLEGLPEPKTVEKSKKSADDVFIWEWLDAAGRVQQTSAKKKNEGSVVFASYQSFLKGP